MPTATSKLADLHDAERHTVGLAGIRAANGIVRDILSRILRAYPRGLDPSLIIQPALVPLIPVVRDAMVAAHLRGYVRSFLTAAPRLRREPSRVAMSVYSDTINFLQKRAEMDAAKIAALRAQYGDQAFAVVKQAGAAIENKVQQAIQGIKEKQLITRDAIAELRVKMQAAGLQPSSNVVETVFRTQNQIAYSVGRQEANARPEIDEILWGLEYATVGDDRVRPAHAALDGVKLPKDDPRWNSIMPPNGYNCRCTVVEIFNDSSLAEPAPPEPFKIIDGERVVPGPDKGWDFNPARVFAA